MSESVPAPPEQKQDKENDDRSDTIDDKNNDVNNDSDTSDILIIDTGSPDRGNGEGRKRNRSSVDDVKSHVEVKKEESMTENGVEVKKEVKEESSGDAKKGNEKRRRSSVKFDELENAMEAMFAGIEEPIKKENGSAKKSDSESTKKTEEVKPKRKYVKKNPKEPKTPKTPKEAKKLSKLSRQEKLLNKFNGPFVHIQGDIKDPKWSNVINTSTDHMKPYEKSKKGINELEQQKNAEQYGLTSTLSNKYDAKRPDENWLCVFCKKGTHFQGLGDLFGPYVLPGLALATTPKSKKSPTEKELAAKFILGGGTDSRRIKKKSRKPSITSENKDLANAVWFHEDCVCWLPDISLLGTRLVGLESSIKVAEEKTCCVCQLTGSSIVCLRCKKAAHVPCAVRDEWDIDQKNFQAYCKTHEASQN